MCHLGRPGWTIWGYWSQISWNMHEMHTKIHLNWGKKCQDTHINIYIQDICNVHFMPLVNYCWIYSPFRSWGSGWAVESDNHPFIQLFSVCRAIHFFYSLYYFSPFLGVKLSKSRHHFDFLYIFFFHFSPISHGRQFAPPQSEPILSSNITPKVIDSLVLISFLIRCQNLEVNNGFYCQGFLNHDNHLFLTSLTKDFLLLLLWPGALKRLIEWDEYNKVLRATEHHNLKPNQHSVYSTISLYQIRLSVVHNPAAVCSLQWPSQKRWQRSCYWWPNP